MPQTTEIITIGFQFFRFVPPFIFSFYADTAPGYRTQNITLLWVSTFLAEHGFPPAGESPNYFRLIVLQNLPVVSIRCEFQLSTQAVQKSPFSISEFVIFLFNELASFQLTLIGNNKSYYDMHR